MSAAELFKGLAASHSRNRQPVASIEALPYPTMLEALIQNGFRPPSRNDPSIPRARATRNLIQIAAEERALNDRLARDARAGLSLNSLAVSCYGPAPEQTPGE